MTTKKAINKKKGGLTRLMVLSLVISFFILYLVAVSLWGIYGYDTSLSFFISLLKSNQVSLNGLNDTLLSYPVVRSATDKLNTFLSNESITAQTQNILDASTNGLKQGLSGFLSEDVISDAFDAGQGFLNQSYVFLLKAGWLFVLVLKIFLIKTCLLIAAIPLFALLGVVGLIDGLSQREIRRAELGRESSYLFHMLNKWIAKIIGLGLCIWVCLPLTVNPQWFFVPEGLMFAVMLSLSASKFKKYL
jgi:integrating conjugative element membrane protein (TIGR03747 family)